jgi:hypothetical protein
MVKPVACNSTFQTSSVIETALDVFLSLAVESIKSLLTVFKIYFFPFFWHNGNIFWMYLQPTIQATVIVLF